MAAEAGAARNTLLAYERDLRGASELLGGSLADAGPGAIRRLAEAWMPLSRATVARKAAALRRPRPRARQGGGAGPFLRLPPGRGEARRRPFRGAAAAGARTAVAQGAR